jgi:hypothetical protein
LVEVDMALSDKLTKDVSSGHGWKRSQRDDREIEFAQGQRALVRQPCKPSPRVRIEE